MVNGLADVTMPRRATLKALRGFEWIFKANSGTLTGNDPRGEFAIKLCLGHWSLFSWVTSVSLVDLSRRSLNKVIDL